MSVALPPTAASRLFIALWPDDKERAQLRAWRDGWTWPADAALVADGRLHLTLHFLGNIAAARIAELAEGIALSFSPFELEFGHAALWPHGIAVLEPEAVPPELLALHANLGAALRALGIATDSRPFKPHVTLARRAQHAIPPANGPSLRWPARGYALMASRLGADGGYSVLRHYA